jgi:ribonuclease HII
MHIAIENILEKIPKENISQILIDGRDNYTFSHIDMNKVQYIIRGDLTQKIISAASIVAKVSRDQIMCDFSVDYPQYAFHLHKGYGTEKHEQALLHYGISPLHRKSYAPVKRLISVDS